ncbi:hypothetical protein JG687_00015323 [Phytophthora cactorum]|uniref:Uncharacterized protein n=1 Tax=Phytophthora cactorum TaxID=29920 RepID=A0A8T1TUW6_9STRA|nr:hypothetical protein JG687_00015323 [Phytophthora cactorum]
MLELRAKIDAAFDTVVSDTWINAYQHAQKFEEKYMQQADACELAADAVDESDEVSGDAEEGYDLEQGLCDRSLRFTYSIHKLFNTIKLSSHSVYFTDSSSYDGNLLKMIVRLHMGDKRSYHNIDGHLRGRPSIAKNSATYNGTFGRPK